MIKSLLYPLVGSALITITPFLLTFEKGQDIVRGLFGFEVFVLLLLVLFIKDFLKQYWANKLKRVVALVFLSLAVIALLVVAWIDLQNLLSIKAWETGWYRVLPFVTVGLSLAMLYPLNSFSIRKICLIVFVALFAHIGSYEYYAAQPIAQFPVVDYLDRIAPKSVQRKNLREDFLSRFEFTDSVSITRDYLDSSRTNVLVLVESWGVPLDTAFFARELALFDNVLKAGAHNRMYSRTRTAEREDLVQDIVVNSAKHKDTLFLPQVYAHRGYETLFMYGGDSLLYGRYLYLRNVGFENIMLGAYMDICDSSGYVGDMQMAAKLDSVLDEKTQKHFIAWTTTDTRFPIAGTADEVDSVYTLLLMNTLNLVADLARKHPEARFIVQGDHNPILSPLPFQERFYKRWVPYLVLN